MLNICDFIQVFVLPEITSLTCELLLKAGQKITIADHTLRFLWKCIVRVGISKVIAMRTKTFSLFL